MKKSWFNWNVSDTLSIQKVLKQGDASLPLQFTFALEYTLLEYTIRKVQGN